MKPLWVIGSGGHAKVVIDTARSIGHYEIVGCLDDNLARRSEKILGVRVIADSSIRSIREFGVEFAVIAIGSNTARKSIANRLSGIVSWETLVHPAAAVSETVIIDAGTVVFAGAVIQPDTNLGQHIILNTGCSVDHDGAVADFAHVGPGARLAGNVTVGQGAFLGVGSSVIPGVRIGQWAVLGAGGVAIRDVPAHTTVAGVPARVIRDLSTD